MFFNRLKIPCMRDSKGKDTNNMTKTNPITLFFADEIDTVVHVLKGGGVVLMPTDTIWGLSCLAADPKAVERIQRIKGRTPDKPFILLVDSIEMLKQYVEDLPPRIENLLVYHERPITIVYPKGKNLPPHNIHVDGSVAIRICNEPFCKEVIRRLGQPIVSTSANRSEKPPPPTFRDIDEQIIQAVDYVVRYRQNDDTPRQPSPIFTYDMQNKLVPIRLQ